ncbi:MAG: HTH domain-containing protein [Firmicutes bacterium]|nr:HTH domain-containing protein [Bacillota bacterium]
MSLLTKIHELENVLKRENKELNEVIALITNLIECNGYLVGNQGEILAKALPKGADCTKPNQKASSLKPEFQQRISFIFQTSANIPMENCFFEEDLCIRPNLYMTITPVRANRSTSTHLLLTKPEEQFTEEQLILAEIAALVISIYMYENSVVFKEAEKNQEDTARMVLDSLSFSELKAVKNVLSDLNAQEGFLVASKIADRIGISRSVIVNAMRKLESAGVVESRSLGIKGTYIKIKNQLFYKMLLEHEK